MSACRCVLALLSLSAQAALAGSPALNLILPRGAQRGTELVVNLHGERLAEPQTLLFYRPGITLKSLEGVNAGHVRATLTLAPDCPLGLHAIRLVTSSGISHVRLFSVGNCPEIVEAEPNSDRRTPQRVTLPTTINGTIDAEDVDYFAFDAAAGQRLNFEIEAMRLGDSVFDPHLSVFDAAGAVLASADDTMLVRQDCVISHVFAQAGPYTVAVREASFRGDGNCRYRLHVGEFPRPQGVFPPGGAPGAALDLRWLGDPACSTERVTIPEAAAGDFALFPSTPAGVAPSGVPFRVDALAQTLEVEPNDALEAATPAAAPGALAGVLQAPGDVDWFRFAVVKGQGYDIRVQGRALRSPIDSVIGVRRVGGDQSADNDDAAGPDSALRFTATDDGQCALYIHDLLRGGGELYTYRVEITPVAPRLLLSAPPEFQHLAVPQANRNAMVVSLARQDYGGAMRLAIGQPPAGVALLGAAAEGPAGVDMPASLNAMPIVLEAAADAPLAAALCDFVARPADGAATPSAAFAQSVRLTEFMDNTMAAAELSRLPVAVTRRAPFSIQVDEPRVPLVRRGRVDVRVVAQRADGFAEPISLRVLWTPPGVGSGTATIPADKTDATIALDANDGAALGSWPLVVVAVANADGPLQVASQYAHLQVAEAQLDLALERARLTQGAQCEMLVKATRKAGFAGTATAELRGLPKNVTAPPLQVTADAAEWRFALSAAADAPVGRYDGVYVAVTIPMEGGAVAFASPANQLFVDAPLPPESPQAAAPPPPPGQPPADPGRRSRPARRPEFAPGGAGGGT